MIHKCRTLTTAANGVEIGAHATGLLPVAAYDNDITDGEVMWHWHHEVEIICMLKGSLIVSIPNEQIVVDSGEILFINSGIMHAAVNADAGECTFHTAVFLPEFLCNGIEGIFWRKYICPFIENTELRSVKFANDLANTITVRECFEQFWTAVENEPFGYEFIIREQLSRIFCSIISAGKNNVRTISTKDERAGERVKVMLEYIHENYMSEITIDALATYASISESECQRCFRRVLGTTPIQYLKQYRLQLAADMLMTTDYTVTEIAGRCGFGHMSYFSRAFDEMFGVTPREYRTRVE